jgi:hypothetical protein
MPGRGDAGEDQRCYEVVAGCRSIEAVFGICIPWGKHSYQFG